MTKDEETQLLVDLATKVMGWKLHMMPPSNDYGPSVRGYYYEGAAFNVKESPAWCYSDRRPMLSWKEPWEPHKNFSHAHRLRLHIQNKFFLGCSITSKHDVDADEWPSLTVNGVHFSRSGPTDGTEEAGKPVPITLNKIESGLVDSLWHWDPSEEMAICKAALSIMEVYE